MVLGVLAEHSFSFAMTPVMVDLAKELSRDKHALNRLALTRTVASCKMRLGVAKTFEERLLSTLRLSHFSLNMDKSMSKNHKRVLTLSTPVSYFSEDQKEIVIQHLASMDFTVVTSYSLFHELYNLFQSKKIPWCNLVSILMDSCGVMRGSKNGLEVQIREKKASHLLDIDGDSCHHVHNSAKKFCDLFNRYLESPFTQLYNDHKWSPDLREALSEICISTIHLLDAYVIFYYSLLSTTDTRLYKPVIDAILKRRKVGSEARREKCTG